MILNLAEFSPSATYHVLTQAVIPRPIAWVLSQNEDGKNHNLAPFSYFTPIASDPPLVLFSVGKKTDGTDKDTTINCLREERFVIHIADESQMPIVQATASELVYGESEVEASELELVDFNEFDDSNVGVNLKRVADAPIAFACKLYKSEEIGHAPQTLIYAEVESIYVKDDAITQTDERTNIDAKIIAPLARLGGGFYSGLSELLLSNKDK